MTSRQRRGEGRGAVSNSRIPSRPGRKSIAWGQSLPDFGFLTIAGDGPIFGSRWSWSILGLEREGLAQPESKILSNSAI